MKCPMNQYIIGPYQKVVADAEKKPYLCELNYEKGTACENGRKRQTFSSGDIRVDSVYSEKGDVI